MYCRQRRHLYYGGQILKYYLPPSTAALPLYRRAALSRNSTEHGPYIAERTQKAVYIVRCLWVGVLQNFSLVWVTIEMMFDTEFPM
jgi:hypothetical protein